MQYFEQHINTTIFSFLFITVFAVTNGFASKKLVENWNTTPALDAAWSNTGGHDSQVYINNGELHQILRPYSATESNLPINARNRFADATANVLTKFQTTVRIEAISNISQIPALEYAVAEFTGFFYNTSSNPSDATGDIMYQIRFGDRGNGLEVWWILLEFTDGNYIGYTEHGSGIIAAPSGGWQTGQDYTLQVIYDGAETFTATFGGTPTTPAAVSGPSRLDNATWKGKYIRSRIWINQPFTGDPDTNKLHVVFDDIQIGINADPLSSYDNFDGADAALSLTNWNEKELIRQATVANNMLKMSLKTASTDTIPSDGINLRANLPDMYSKTKYLQVDMRLTGGVIPDATRGQIYAGGIWGNGKYTSTNFPGDSDGGISFQASLIKNHNPPFNYQVTCYMSMCNDASCTAFIDLNLATWGADAAPDTTYTATLTQTGTVFSCKFTNTATGAVLFSESSDISTHGISEVAPIGEYKRLRARVRFNPGEVVSYVDNIYVEGKSSILLNIVPIIGSQAQN